ncbi:hypothetical protein JZU46_00310 [bacterium]|nr:hypothetical protein [bacterium]
MFKNSFTFYFLKQSFLPLRFKLIKFLVGKDPVIMNLTITSDIVSYNKLDSNPRAIFIGNRVKSVCSRQSFVLNPNSDTTQVGF